MAGTAPTFLARGTQSLQPAPKTLPRVRAKAKEITMEANSRSLIRPRIVTSVGCLATRLEIAGKALVRAPASQASTITMARATLEKARARGIIRINGVTFAA